MGAEDVPAKPIVEAEAQDEGLEYVLSQVLHPGDASKPDPRTVQHRHPLVLWPRAILSGLLTLALGIPCLFLLLASALIRLISPRAAYNFNSAIAGSLWRYMQREIEVSDGAIITFSGHQIPERESAIVVSNHLGYLDFALVQGLAIRKGMLGYCRYFAKFDLIFTLPIFGLCMWLIDMVMVKRDWLKDQESVKAAFASIRRHKAPVWLVSYVEGHRATPQRIAQSHAFAKKHDKAQLKHVLLPRTKGFVATVQALRGSQVKHVYGKYLTLAVIDDKGRLQHAPSVVEAWGYSQLSPRWRFHVHAERFAIDDLPKDDEKLAAWLEYRFVQKDSFLDGLAKQWLAAPSVTVQQPSGGWIGYREDPYWL